MNLKKIVPDEFQVSNWSGGKTTQIAIYPPKANYADRDFAFRISSASVELDESIFTLLPDYDRIIAPITGQLTLYYNGSDKPVVLNEMEFSRFDGGWNTRSKGRVTDYNLMTRKGICSGDAFSITLISGETTVIPKQSTTLSSHYIQLIWCIEGAIQIDVADKTMHLALREAMQLDYDSFKDSTDIHIENTGSNISKLMIATVNFI